MPIIEQGSYMQEVRTAVDPEVYDEPEEHPDAMSLTEWLALIGEDSLAQENKLMWAADFSPIRSSPTSVSRSSANRSDKRVTCSSSTN